AQPPARAGARPAHLAGAGGAPRRHHRLRGAGGGREPLRGAAADPRAAGDGLAVAEELCRDAVADGDRLVGGPAEWIDADRALASTPGPAAVARLHDFAVDLHHQ